MSIQCSAQATSVKADVCSCVDGTDDGESSGDAVSVSGFYMDQAECISPKRTGVFVVARSETELTLGWYDDNNNYSYILRGSHGDQHINSSEYLGGVVTHTVSSLSPGTEYTFTVFTVFEGAQSSGYNFTTVTSPSNVEYVHTWQRGKYIDLRWSPVNYDDRYDYVLKFEELEIFFPGIWDLRHSFSSLSPETEYLFTLFTVFEGVRSSGYNVTVVTGLADVESVSVLNCTENEITMEWNKVHNINNYVLVILIDNVHNFISGSDNVSVVRHTVSSLHPGWVHRFILHAVLNREMSDGYLFHTATAPQNVDGVTVQRRKDTSITLKFTDTKHVLGNRHFYILQYGEIEAYTGLHNDDRNYDNLIYHYGPNTEHFLEFFFDHYYEDTYTVTSLSPGTKYNFTLYSVLNGVRSRGYEFTAETTPSKVTGLNCEYSWMGSVITLHWDAQFGLRSEFEVRVNRGIPEQVNVTRYQIDGVPSAVQYDFTVTSLSGGVRSSPVSIKCQTNTSGVIAVCVLVVLLIIVLFVCLGVFCKYRRFDLRRCFLGERVNERNAADQPLDRIYVNTSTHNTPENHNSSVESESKDTSGEINHYEAPDMTL